MKAGEARSASSQTANLTGYLAFHEVHPYTVGPPPPWWRVHPTAARNEFEAMLQISAPADTFASRRVAASGDEERTVAMKMLRR